jgi:ABC-2 type transport system permease protein
MIVLSAVFSTVFRFDVENYPVYLILGQTLFTMMSDATSGAMWSIIENAPLIKKVRLIKIVFPTEKVLFAVLNYAISLIAVFAVEIFFQIPPSPTMFLLPILLLYTTIFSLGIGLLLSSLATFFRDVLHLWGVFIVAWMYLTPIFYPTAILEPWMMNIMDFNPMYHFVTYLRDIMLNGITPSLMENFICIGFALVTLAVGLLIFKKTEKRFILYV